MAEGKETSRFLLQVKFLNLFMEKKNMRLVDSFRRAINHYIFVEFPAFK